MFSPPPWKWDKGFMFLSDKDGNVVFARSVHTARAKNHVSNGRLLRAAPELYKALDELLKEVNDSVYVPQAVLDRAEAALREAR